MPGTRAVRCLAAGPIALELAAPPALVPHVDALLAGVEIAPSPTRLHLTLELSLISASRADRPRQPRFHPAADGALVDRSVAWDARLTLSPGHAHAAFALRDLSEFGPRGERFTALWVAGALRVALAMTAPVIGGLLLHGAALADPAGRGHAFVGKSGAGKTTMRGRLPGWRLLADDAALVLPDDRGGWSIAGTPIPGRERLPRSTHAHPLAALVFLEPRAPSLGLTAISQADALASLLGRILYFAPPDPLVLDSAAALVDAVPAHRLASSLEHDLAPALSPALVEAP